MTSMSGSFQWPGPEKGVQRSWAKPIFAMPLFHDMFPLIQVSVMSPVVRQAWERRAQSAAFLNGAVFDRLSTMSRPVFRSATLISWVVGTSISQSYLR